MTLDEAIRHFYDIAFLNMENDDCVKNNLKIAGWLEDLQKREKGCAYCKHHYRDAKRKNDCSMVVFCPMCGKQIRKDKENEYNENSD